jgi:hypothetical protein
MTLNTSPDDGHLRCRQSRDHPRPVGDGRGGLHRWGLMPTAGSGGHDADVDLASHFRCRVPVAPAGEQTLQTAARGP